MRINAETMRGDRKRRVRTINGSGERCIANIAFYFANHLISFTTASISMWFGDVCLHTVHKSNYQRDHRKGSQRPWIAQASSSLEEAYWTSSFYP